MSEMLQTIGFGRKIFSEEHEAYRSSLRRFFQKEIEPNAKQWQKDGFYTGEVFKAAGKAGLLCAALPEEYGGGGGDMLHQYILHEEHGYSPVGAAMEAGLGTELTAHIIYEHGTEEQKKYWLPRFAAGEVITESGLTEPGTGSDVKAIRTTARKDGDDYVISGQKAWMSNGPIITMLVTVCRTQGPDGKDGYSIFLVPTDLPGVTIGPPTELMTKGFGGVAEIFFDEVRVPKEALLGGVEGKGLRQVLGGITPGRIATAARCVAACELAIELTREYTKQRRIFGQTVFDFQNSQFKLASCKTETTVARNYMDDCMRRDLLGELPDVESAMVKLWTSEVEGRVMDECLQLFGAAGYSDEYPISKMYGFARVHRIVVGTSEIMRQIIARTL